MNNDDLTEDSNNFSLKNGRKRKRPDIIADHLRELIVGNKLQPGDRVPADWVSLEKLKVSRGTLREALTILEFQGLTKSKTGPGGGVFVAEVSQQQALDLINNLFLFQAPSIANIYQIRKLLEPELAATVAGALSDTALKALQETICLYEVEPKNMQQEYEQRLAELDFHIELARYCENRLLGFVCELLANLLKDMTVCREIYQKKNPELRESGLSYQVKLLRAIKSNDAVKARDIMSEHMRDAEKYMLKRAAFKV